MPVLDWQCTAVALQFPPMWTILLCLFLGTLLGVALRQRRRLLVLLDRLTMTAVYLLLFLLGISVGANPVVMAGLGSLGLQALLLSLGGVVGSIVSAALLYRWLFAGRGADA